MFEEIAVAEERKSKKSEEELLRELADLVAVEKRDEQYGFASIPGNDDRIKSLLRNLGYLIA